MVNARTATYTVNPVHRNGALGKSQWRIPRPDEIKCFDGARAAGWLDSDVGWGLHRPDGTPAYVGVARDHETRVFVAKFTGDLHVWHGYPADHCPSYSDIPTERVLGRWMRDGQLSSAKVRKLTPGQPCRL